MPENYFTYIGKFCILNYAIFTYNFNKYVLYTKYMPLLHIYYNFYLILI